MNDPKNPIDAINTGNEDDGEGGIPVDNPDTYDDKSGISISREEIAETFHVGETPWHGYGEKLDDLATAQEALQAAHLDWLVEKRELYWKKGEDEDITVSDWFATVRTDVEEPLGVVKKGYEVLQNVEAVSFLDSLAGTGEAKYETAGALYGGRKLWLLARLPGELEIADGDTIKKYLLLVNSHDGTESLKVLITPVRVVCRNTLQTAITSAEIRVNIRHSKGMKDKVAEARRILELSVLSFDDAAEQYRALSRIPVDEILVNKYFESLFDADTKHFAKVRATLNELYQNGPSAEFGKGTLWGAYNAVTDYVDHYRGGKSAERRFAAVILGAGKALKQQAFNTALEILQDVGHIDA